jgi:hypothetical protein
MLSGGYQSQLNTEKALKQRIGLADSRGDLGKIPQSGNRIVAATADFFLNFD